MPPINKALSENYYLRTFCFGAPKTKKTWWACKCAELGLNVHLLDGDDGAHILQNLSQEARERILVLPVKDRQNAATFLTFMNKFLSARGLFYWNEQEACIDFKPREGFSYIAVDHRKLNKYDVIIIDSWTALAASASLNFALNQGIDLFDAEKKEWEGYGYEGRILSQFLNVFKVLNCHLIVIGHENVIEKKNKRGEVISSRIVPISSSQPHSTKIADKFSDVLYFRKSSEIQFNIETGGDMSRVGGSRLIEPKTYNWNDLTPGDLIKKLTIELPEAADIPKSEAIYWVEDGATLQKDLVPKNNQAIEAKSSDNKPASTNISAKPKSPSGGNIFSKTGLKKD